MIAIALICLLFIAIPISYSGGKQKLVQLQFDEYLQKFNKSYKENPAEYETRLKYFTVSFRSNSIISIHMNFTLI